MYNALGFASAARGVEHKEHVFTVHGLWRTAGGLFRDGLGGDGGREL